MRIGKVVNLYRSRNRGESSAIVIRPIDDPKGLEKDYRYDIELLSELKKYTLGTEVLFTAESRKVTSVQILTSEQQLLKLFAEIKSNYAVLRLARPLPALEQEVKSFARQLAEESLKGITAEKERE
jgi:hypothetical protein